MNDKKQSVRRLHNEAMDFTDRSLSAQRFGQRDEYLYYTRLAYQKEAEAAQLMADEEDIEPTRSVLHRSAAALAYRCEKYREAKRLIYRALSGNTPVDIETELYDLLKKVQNAEAGSQLTEHKLTLTLDGGKVLSQRAPASAVISRLSSVQELILIMARVRGRIDKKAQELAQYLNAYPLYIEGFSAGSVNVHLRLEQEEEGKRLSAFNDFTDIAEPLMENLKLLEEGNYDLLRESIPDYEDFRKFIVAAKEFVPDGDNVSTVNLQTKIRGQVKSVLLERDREELDLLVLSETPQKAEDIKIQMVMATIRKEGVLKAANVFRRTECVLDVDNERAWTITGSEKLIIEIGKEFLNERVIVQGRRYRKGKRKYRLSLESRDDIWRPETFI